MIDTRSKENNMEPNNKQENHTDPSHITVTEFLNFLKTAYQVQGSLEGMLLEGGMGDAVTWLKSKEAEFALKGPSAAIQTSDTLLQTSETEQDPLRHKLNEVLSEGLLDSVLPYLVQSTHSIKKSSSTTINKPTRRKSSGDIVQPITKPTTTNKTESEVEIHVCDEVKNLKKTFLCNQKVLVEKMGYFAEVTLGQKLEDMDISVHCDIGIFEWLMQWVKKDSVLEADWPQLDSQCVIPILVSAAFLQMEPLLQDCLLYCHEHMNEILRTSTNLSCLNDSVLSKLAAMYTNAEVEAVKDRKDKIQSRLFAKLIQSLGEPEPESVRGHWCSLARIFKCQKCQQLISPEFAAKIHCAASQMRLQPDGGILNVHSKDDSWDINDYILKLYKTLKTWRKVYWRLWGEAHFLYCIVCKRYFPVNQIGWCQYHPDTPQFFTLDAQKAPLPIGRYPCCGERAYRFQLLENPSACQFRQHTITLDEVRDSAVFTMLEIYRELIEEEPPNLLFPERLTRLVARDSNSINSERFVCKETFWWDGFEIVPPRPRIGLLTVFSQRTDPCESQLSDDSTTEEESISSTSMESEEGSAESNPPPKRPLTRKTKKKSDGKLWQHNLSARSNQDIQRAYEESILKEMASVLNSRTEGRGNRNLVRHSNTGGLWTRLEAEWKESMVQKDVQLKLKNPATAKPNKPRSRF